MLFEKSNSTTQAFIATNFINCSLYDLELSRAFKKYLSVTYGETIVENGYTFAEYKTSKKK